MNPAPSTSNTTPTKNGAKPAPAAAPPRMTLANIRKGRIAAPLRVLLYGVEGVGKSTWASQAPSPVFLTQERGTEELDVARLPEPRTWSEVLEALRILETTPSDYKTLVVDVVNWLEPLAWNALCAQNGWSSIEEPGYGKGYDAAVDLWRGFVTQLDRIRDVRGMHVVLLAHAQVKSFNDPDADAPYDRYELAMNKKAAGVLKQWSSAVLFAKHEVGARKDKKTKHVRAVSTGCRLVFTQWTAAYDAKNRYNLPETLPLSWDEFAAAVEAGRGQADGAVKQRADEARDRIEAMLANPALEGFADKARGLVAKAGDDPVKLADIENRLSARLAQTKDQGGES